MCLFVRSDAFKHCIQISIKRPLAKNDMFPSKKKLSQTFGKLTKKDDATKTHLKMIDHQANGNKAFSWAKHHKLNSPMPSCMVCFWWCIMWIYVSVLAHTNDFLVLCNAFTLAHAIGLVQREFVVKCTCSVWMGNGVMAVMLSDSSGFRWKFCEMSHLHIVVA